MKKCPVCNSTFDDSQMFCLVDGKELITLLEPTVSFAAEKVPTPKKRRGIILPLFFVLVILAGIGIGVLFLYNFLTGNRQVLTQNNKPANIAVNVPPTPTATPLPTVEPTPTIITPPANISPENTNSVAGNRSPTTGNTPLPTPNENGKTGNLPPTEPITKTESITKVEGNGVLMTINYCRKSGTMIVCEISVTNRSENDIKFSAYSSVQSNMN